MNITRNILMRTSFSLCNGYVKFSSQYLRPRMATNLPGPKSKELINSLYEIQPNYTVRFVADYSNSHGNFITDVDSNFMLDLFCQFSTLPLGYNHPYLQSVAQSQEYQIASINRASLGMFPPKDYKDRLMNSLMSVAPKGMTHVQTMMCGACSVENAIKAVFIHHKTKERKGKSFTQEEIDSCMENKEPGSANLSILSFKKGFHGRTLGALCLTRSKAIHKIDFPAFHWPQADFPLYKYGLEENADYNNRQDKLCLEMVEDTIHKWSTKSPIAGLIVEAIIAEGGDISASDDFYRKLRNICSKHGVSFIVDEVQTGCGPTGTFWAHEQWNLSQPPDIVVFAKKMLLGGYYTTKEYFPEQGYRLFNTWMGETSKVLLLEGVLKAIKDENLIEETRKTGIHLLNGLRLIQNNSGFKILNVRGKGTFCAFDCESAEKRNELISAMGNLGFVLGGCGEKSVRFRPALILKPYHVDLFLEALNKYISTQ